MYDIRVNTKGDRYGEIKRVIARTPEDGKYTALINAMEEVNNNKFVYDYENNDTINTENITSIYLQEEN